MQYRSPDSIQELDALPMADLVHFKWQETQSSKGFYRVDHGVFTGREGEKHVLDRFEMNALLSRGRKEGYELPHLQLGLSRLQPSGLHTGPMVALTAVFMFLGANYGCQLGSEAGKGYCRDLWSGAAQSVTDFAKGTALLVPAVVKALQQYRSE